MRSKRIYCCGCLKHTYARLTDGDEIYPYRKDLAKKSFWVCDTCGNYVGCHSRSGKKRPLGTIPTKEIRAKRVEIHRRLDPLWMSERMKRYEVYSWISDRLGKEFHVGNINSIQEAEQILIFIAELEKQCLLGELLQDELTFDILL